MRRESCVVEDLASVRRKLAKGKSHVVELRNIQSLDKLLEFYRRYLSRKSEYEEFQLHL